MSDGRSFGRKVACPVCQGHRTHWVAAMHRHITEKHNEDPYKYFPHTRKEDGSSKAAQTDEILGFEYSKMGRICGWQTFSRRTGTYIWKCAKKPCKSLRFPFRIDWSNCPVCWHNPRDSGIIKSLPEVNVEKKTQTRSAEDAPPPPKPAARPSLESKMDTVDLSNLKASDRSMAKVLALLIENGPCNNKRISSISGTPKRSLYTITKSLHGRGYIKANYSFDDIRSPTWFVPEDGMDRARKFVEEHLRA